NRLQFAPLGKAMGQIAGDEGKVFYNRRNASVGQFVWRSSIKPLQLLKPATGCCTDTPCRREAKASRPTTNLVRFGGSELTHLFAVELRKLKEADPIGGQVEAHAYRISRHTDFRFAIGKAIRLAAAYFRRQVAVDDRDAAFAHLQFGFKVQDHAARECD